MSTVPKTSQLKARKSRFTENFDDDSYTPDPYYLQPKYMDTVYLKATKATKSKSSSGSESSDAQGKGKRTSQNDSDSSQNSIITRDQTTVDGSKVDQSWLQRRTSAYTGSKTSDTKEKKDAWKSAKDKIKIVLNLKNAIKVDKGKPAG
ncbi:hypothetical protein BZA77DRAFT_356841 [Pyronema omphalodes]|nr:hypothetical protein BZA77DRAFT_356841 [Pyronema omphalodes]